MMGQQRRNPDKTKTKWSNMTRAATFKEDLESKKKAVAGEGLHKSGTHVMGSSDHTMV